LIVLSGYPIFGLKVLPSTSNPKNYRKLRISFKNLKTKSNFLLTDLASYATTIACAIPTPIRHSNTRKSISYTVATKTFLPFTQNCAHQIPTGQCCTATLSKSIASFVQSQRVGLEIFDRRPAVGLQNHDHGSFYKDRRPHRIIWMICDCRFIFFDFFWLEITKVTRRRNFSLKNWHKKISINKFKWKVEIFLRFLGKKEDFSSQWTIFAAQVSKPWNFPSGYLFFISSIQTKVL
jgi:hypothetical protein